VTADPIPPRPPPLPVQDYEELVTLPLLDELLPRLESKSPERALDLDEVASRLRRGDRLLLWGAARLAAGIDPRLESLLRWAVSAPDAGDRPAPAPPPGPPAPGPLDLEGIFGRGGALDRARRDYREAQEEMARRVDGALRGGEILLVEGGTGVGKSLGYLVPALGVAIERGERIVVSTHTRNLQVQLLRQDIPLAARLAGSAVPVALLMGRANYLCGRALSAVVSGGGEAVDPGVGEGWTPRSALAVALASLLDDRGEVESCAGLPGVPANSLERLRGGDERCPARACSLWKGCPLQRARARAASARLVVVNHSLLLSDLSAGGSILGGYELLVVDEAHHLDRVATEHFGRTMGPGDLGRVFDILGERGRDGEHPGWRTVESFLAEHLEPEAVGRIRARWEGVRDLLPETKRAYGDFFRALERGAPPPPPPARTTRLRYRSGPELFGEMAEEVRSTATELTALDRALESLVTVLDDQAHRLEPVARPLQDVVAWSAATRTLLETFTFLTRADDEDHVFWLEVGRKGRAVRVGSNPVFVGGPISELLRGTPRSAVLTSATLSVGGSFEFVLRNLGLESGEGVETLRLPSPFDYESQSLFVVAGYTRPPTDPEYERDVARILVRLSAAQGRRILCLFTSVSMQGRVAALLRGEALAGPLLVQGAGEGRDELAGRLRGERGAVLLGLASFWEGVDFPGEALEILVIPRLPFPVPTDPLVQARTERIEAEGANGFLDYAVPEAILRFKQGVGRLIRSRRDRGVVVLLDSRLARRSYGLRMLHALPARPALLQDEDLLVEEVDRFFLSPSP
jgi:ATP-dependent DNA helicase DinG